MDSEAKVKIAKASQSLGQALADLREAKPGDRSERDRYCQIVITDVEKAMAVFDRLVYREIENDV